MKKIYLIAQQPMTSEAVKKQLLELFGPEIEIVAQTVDQCAAIDFSDGLVVITSPWVENYAQKKIKPGLNYLVAKRVINYDHLDKLGILRDGEDVLVCSPWDDVKLPAIDQLREIGFGNINFIPCGNDDLNPEHVPTAIVFSDAVVPPHVQRVIEMSPRMLDVSTLVEIQKRLNLLNENAVLCQFFRRIVSVMRRLNEESSRHQEVKLLYQAIVNNVSEGIIYSDNQGIIQITNQAAAKFFSQTTCRIIGANIRDLLAAPNLLQDADFDKTIVNSGGPDLAVSRVSLRQAGATSSFVFILEDVEKILQAEQKIRLRNLSHETAARYTFHDIQYRSDKIRTAISNARKFAQSSETILIQGGSGTGKEIFAQAIHNQSPRKNGPFVPVNFAALTETLLESELFGYEEGSFTGAKKGGKRGLFERAHRGTIFIDEIGDAPVAFQSRLLRVLQEKQVKRVGSTEIVPIDIRVIAATNLDLWQEVVRGRFRQDLFFRLNVLPLFIPGLRERKEDILFLLEHFFRENLNSPDLQLEDVFSPEALSLLIDYEWPGNVRELINVVKYSCALRQPGKQIKAQDLHLYGRPCPVPEVGGESTCQGDMKWILQMIDAHQGAGRRLLAEEAEKEGINLSEGQIRTYLKKLQSHGLVQINIGASGCLLTEKGRRAAAASGPVIL